MREGHTMSRYGLPFAGMLLAVAAPAIAQSNEKAPTEPGDIVVTGKIRDADKKVCKTQVATGSIMPKRTCRPKGEWEEIRTRSLARLERLKEEERTRAFIEENRRNR